MSIHVPTYINNNSSDGDQKPCEWEDTCKARKGKRFSCLDTYLGRKQLVEGAKHTVASASAMNHYGTPAVDR